MALASPLLIGGWYLQRGRILAIKPKRELQLLDEGIERGRGVIGRALERDVAVAIAAAYTFVLVRVAGAIALLSAPVFPFTAIALADMVMTRRAERGG